MPTRRSLLLAFLLLWACEDSTTTPGTGLMLELETSAADLDSVDGVVAHLEGPVSISRTIEAGDSLSFDGLEPGSYQLAVEWLKDDRVAWFHESAVEVERGSVRAERVVPRPFVSAGLSTATEEGRTSVRWTPVAAASRYRVEASGPSEADGWQERGTTEDRSLDLGELAPGEYLFRVEAINRLGHAGEPAEVSHTSEGMDETYTLTLVEEVGGLGTVTSDPEGIRCGIDIGGGPVQCAAEFEAGTEVTLDLEWVYTQRPERQFGGWEGAGCSGFRECTVTMDGPQEVVMTRAAEVRSVFLDFEALAPEQWPGHVGVYSDVGYIFCRRYIGTLRPIVFGECTYPFPVGVEVELVARQDASDDRIPVEWAGCDSQDASTCRFTVRSGEGYQKVRAIYDPIDLRRHTVRVESTGEGEGRVISEPWGIECYNVRFNPIYPIYNDCTGDFREGTEVTLTATPEEGFRFVGWEVTKDRSEEEGGPQLTGAGLCLDTAPCTFTVDQDRRVTAEFERADGLRRLSVERSRQTGRIYSEPAGIDCGTGLDGVGGVCEAEFPDGASVSLLMDWPADSSRFGGWEGAGCSGFRECEVVMDRDRSVTATSAEEIENFRHAVSVELYPDPLPLGFDYRVALESDIRPIRCELVRNPPFVGRDCDYFMAVGVPISLWVTDVDTGARLPVGWSACDAPGEFVCDHTFTGYTGVILSGTWEPEIVTRELIVIATDVGRIDLDADDLSCVTTSCTYAVLEGFEVTLTATPVDEAWQFAGWAEGGCEGQGSTCTVTMDRDRMERAIWEPIGTARLTLDVTTEATLTYAPIEFVLVGVVGEPSGRGVCYLNAGECAFDLPEGAAVILEPLWYRESPLAFAGWAGDGCPEIGNCTLAMDGDRTVQAVFTDDNEYFLMTPRAVGDYRAGDTFTLLSDFGVAEGGCRLAIYEELGGGLVQDLDGDGCDRRYVEGTTLTLRALDGGPIPVQWTGCDSFTESTCTLTIREGENRPTATRVY